MMKVIKPLENRGNLLTGTTRKTSSQEGVFLNFREPLITAGLLLTESELTPLANTVFSP